MPKAIVGKTILSAKLKRKSSAKMAKLASRTLASRPNPGEPGGLASGLAANPRSAAMRRNSQRRKTEWRCGDTRRLTPPARLLMSTVRPLMPPVRRPTTLIGRSKPKTTERGWKSWAKMATLGSRSAISPMPSRLPFDATAFGPMLFFRRMMPGDEEIVNKPAEHAADQRADDRNPPPMVVGAERFGAPAGQRGE
jgi:hypothetical protein